MSRQKQKKKRDKKRSYASPVATAPVTSRNSRLTEARRGRMMTGAVRRGERQPGRSS